MEQDVACNSGYFLSDDADFDVLCRRVHPLVYAAALRLTRNCDDAQDVVQEVLCKLWIARSLRGPKCLEKWLTTVTRNAAIDLLRKRTREHRYLMAKQPHIEHFVSVEEETLRALELEELQSALQRLGDDSRKLLIESFVAGESHAAIARHRSMALGTVKSRIRAGLKRLHGLMASA